MTYKYSGWLIIGAMLLALVPISLVNAQDDPVILTEAQIEAIEQRCLASKVALNNVHSADGLQRVNIGQRYADISARLMGPFNSRVALNGMDGVELTELTVKYNRALSTFRDRYVTYDDSTSLALSIDCQTRPIDYYAAVEAARERREILRTSVTELNDLLKQYNQALNQFEASMERD